jgi:hypothetical protein
MQVTAPAIGHSGQTVHTYMSSLKTIILLICNYFGYNSLHGTDYFGGGFIIQS